MLGRNVWWMSAVLVGGSAWAQAEPELPAAPEAPAAAAATVATPATPVAASSEADADNPVELKAVVVTATRTNERRENVPQSIEVVSGRDLDNTQSDFLSDALKKNASLDIADFGGGNAGFGIRGERAASFNLNTGVLFLVDGRPAGSTSFGTQSRDGVERIEVLKGAASSLYGGSAQSGVINIITKRSHGKLRGFASVGVGSFNALDAQIAYGGGIGYGIDFDVGFSNRAAHDDFTTGGGRRVFNTEYGYNSGRVRLGADVGDRWRIDGSFDYYISNDVGAPGATTFDDGSGVTRREEDRFAGDLTIRGDLGAHAVQIKYYRTSEYTERLRIPPVTPVVRGQSTTDLGYQGIQAQDAWTILPWWKAVIGGEFEDYNVISTTTNVAGALIGPSRPVENRNTTAGYVENIFDFFDERLIINGGVRYDYLITSTRATPLRPDLTPGQATFNEVNPRGGIVWKFLPAFRLHGNAGRAFIAPAANQSAALSEVVVGRQTRIRRGNPNLSPSSSLSYDFGIGFDKGPYSADLTYFASDFKDAIIDVITLETPTLRITDVQNANTSKASGLEGQLSIDIGSWLGQRRNGLTLSGSFQRLFKAREYLTTGPRQVLDVARFQGNLALDYDNGGVFYGRVLARYRGDRETRDNTNGLIFTGGRGGNFDSPEIVVVDLSANARLTRVDTLRVQISNLFDRDYFDATDFNRPGRALYAFYRRSF